MTEDQTIPTNDASNDVAVGGPFDIRHLTAAELGSLGVSQIAYIKPVVVNGVPAVAIHAADGTPMALAPNQEVATAAITQHDMVAALVQ